MLLLLLLHLSILSSAVSSSVTIGERAVKLEPICLDESKCGGGGRVKQAKEQPQAEVTVGERAVKLKPICLDDTSPGCQGAGNKKKENVVESDNDEQDDTEDTEVAFIGEEDCIDYDKSCQQWAEAEECIENPRYMLENCPRSCDVCGTRLSLGMGKPQIIHEEHAWDIWERMLQAREYLNQVVWEDEFLSQSYDACVNKDKWCAFWAVTNECEGKDKEWMASNCGPVCQTCEQTSIYTKCPLDPDAKNALEPGDLDKLFERIISAEEYKKYEPKVWSRPYYKEGDSEETADYIISAWLVTLENFVSEEEAQRLIELGGLEGYDISTAVGDIQDDGTVELYKSDYRTSTNAWCHEACAEDPIATGVSERMGEVVGVPVDYSENFQLLRYEPGQFYKVHHDYLHHERDRQQGPRILTAYLYLNEVEEGGETNFPELNVTVAPKRGRVAIWPSVFSEFPSDKDGRTEHQALPVIKGEKYGANIWFHLRNYTEAEENDCLGI